MSEIVKPTSVTTLSFGLSKKYILSFPFCRTRTNFHVTGHDNLTARRKKEIKVRRCTIKRCSLVWLTTRYIGTTLNLYLSHTHILSLRAPRSHLANLDLIDIVCAEVDRNSEAPRYTVLVKRRRGARSCVRDARDSAESLRRTYLSVREGDSLAEFSCWLWEAVGGV